MTDSDRSPLTAAAMDPENNEFATPTEIWRPLSRAVDGFDLDPCSGAEAVPIAPERYTKEDDGLRQPWHGDVFVNPPWSGSDGDGSAKEAWLQKAISEALREETDRIIVLLPVDTSTHWFHSYVVEAESVCFVGPGRIPFEGGDRNPSFGLLIAVFGPVDDRLANALDTFGVVFRGRSVHNPAPQRRLVHATDGGTSGIGDTGKHRGGEP